MITLFFLTMFLIVVWFIIGYMIVVFFYMVYLVLLATAKMFRSVKLEALALKIRGKSTVGLDAGKSFKEARAEARQFEYSTLWKKKFEEEFGMKGPKFGQGFKYQAERLAEIKKEARKEAEQFKAEQRKKQKEARKRNK